MTVTCCDRRARLYCSYEMLVRGNTHLLSKALFGFSAFACDSADENGGRFCCCFPVHETPPALRIIIHQAPPSRPLVRKSQRARWCARHNKWNNESWLQSLHNFCFSFFKKSGDGERCEKIIWRGNKCDIIILHAAGSGLTLTSWWKFTNTNFVWFLGCI